MATLWQILSLENRNKLAKWYKKRFGKDLIPPGSDARSITCEPKLESLEEIDKLMRQKPYGRMGRG